MHCENARKQLNALADGELNRWQEWQIHRHLRHCAACSDELATIRQIGDQAQAWRHVSAPNMLKARIVSTLAESPNHDSSLLLPNEENTPMNTQTTVLASPQNHTNQQTTGSQNRIRMNRRPIPTLSGFWMTLSGIGVALVIMALLILPTRKSFAFAAVIQAMQQVKSIHWTVKVDGAAQPEKSLEGSDEGNVVEGWARLDKPAIALLFGGGGEVKMLVTPDKHTMITNDKQLMDIPVPWLEGKGKDKEAALRDFILAQLVLPTKDAFQGVGKNDNINLLNYFGQERFQREDVVFEGKRVVQFTLDQRFREAGFTVSLWVDPDTHLILRSETRIPNPSQGQPDVVTIAAQLRYDEEPPIGIFDLPTK